MDAPQVRSARLAQSQRVEEAFNAIEGIVCNLKYATEA